MALDRVCHLGEVLAIDQPGEEVERSHLEELVTAPAERDDAERVLTAAHPAGPEVSRVDRRALIGIGVAGDTRQPPDLLLLSLAGGEAGSSFQGGAAPAHLSLSSLRDAVDRRPAGQIPGVAEDLAVFFAAARVAPVGHSYLYLAAVGADVLHAPSQPVSATGSFAAIQAKSLSRLARDVLELGAVWLIQQTLRARAAFSFPMPGVASSRSRTLMPCRSAASESITSARSTRPA